MKTIPESAATTVRTRFGKSLEFSFAGWPHGQSLMWKATDRSERVLYVKIHAERYLHERHAAALRAWAPQLPCPTPEVLYEDGAQLLMVFSALNGVPLEAISIAPDRELESYATAGRVARALHGIDVNGVGEDWSAVHAMRETLERSVAKCKGRVDDDLLFWARTIAAEMDVFAGERRVPCHRDYSPRNWLVAETDGGLEWSLIDFERARLDLRYADLKRMWSDEWKDRPDRREAFFEGYGVPLTPDEELRLKIAVAVNCLGTIPWAAEHHDPALGQWARNTLVELRETW